jgi:hypothetical protein
VHEDPPSRPEEPEDQLENDGFSCPARAEHDPHLTCGTTKLTSLRMGDRRKQCDVLEDDGGEFMWKWSMVPPCGAAEKFTAAVNTAKESVARYD